MSDQADPELLEFPCEFALKAIGLKTPELPGHIENRVRARIAAPETLSIQTRPSKAGSYIAITASFTAHNRDELDDLYRQLSADPKVKMAL